MDIFGIHMGTTEVIFGIFAIIFIVVFMRNEIEFINGCGGGSWLDDDW